MERIENKTIIHKKIIYNDKENNYNLVDISEYDKCFVKIFISNKTDEDMFNNFIEKFYNKINVNELQIIDDPIDITQTVKDNILDEGEDTLTFLNNYIDQIDTEIDRTKLKKFAKELYTEASE